MKEKIESNKPIYDVATRCHVNIPEISRMTIKMKENTKLKPLTYYGVSNDPNKDI
jgi:hypothetical protein